MARSLSRSLIPRSQRLIVDLFSVSSFFPAASLHDDRCHLQPPLSVRLFNLRCRSDLPDKAQIVEIDLSAEVGSDGIDSDAVRFRLLEDAVQVFLAKKLAPAWLPFVPGASYWVPPPRQRRVRKPQIIDRLPVELATRGWPSSEYFMEGISPHSLKNYKRTTPESDDDE